MSLTGRSEMYSIPLLSFAAREFIQIAQLLAESMSLLPSLQALNPDADAFEMSTPEAIQTASQCSIILVAFRDALLLDDRSDQRSSEERRAGF